MNSDSIVSVYSDTRSEYTKQLCIFLVPAYFRFFVDLFTKAKQSADPKKALWQFQTYLNEIHDWNMEKVQNEINTINTNAGCDYLEDLLTAVFIAHTKVLTAIRLSANNKKVEITIPKVDHFLFKVLCEISKLLWSSTYLFREDISGIDRQQNYKLIEGMIGEGISQAIRSLVPVKSILKNLVNHEDEKDDSKSNSKDDAKDDINDNDSDEEDTIVKKPLVTLEPPVTSSNNELAAVTLPAVEPIVPAIDALTSKTDSKDAQPVIPPVALKAASLIPQAASLIPQVASLIPSIAELVEPTPETTTIPPIPALEEKNDTPTIINLDEKPKVSFGSFNSFFSDEPENTDMINATNENTPDLEILDTDGSALSGDDFDDLNAPVDEPLDDYEEL
jgi:hypothetical protein